MSDGNRLRNYALGLAAGLLLAFYIGSRFWIPATEQDLSIQRQATENAREYAEAADVAVRQECAAIEASTEQHDCITEEREPYREAQRNEHDLEAQKIMANWTRAMGQAAIIGMGIGIVGLFLIFTTFWETRKAAESANKTYEAFVKVERPTLVPTVSKVYGTKDKAGNGIKYVNFEITNLGKGDAVLKSMTWGFSQEAEGSEVLNGPPITKTIKAGTPFQPGVVKANAGPHVEETFVLVVKYESVFSPEHISRRRWRVREGIATEVPFTDAPDT